MLLGIKFWIHEIEGNKLEIIYENTFLQITGTFLNIMIQIFR